MNTARAVLPTIETDTDVLSIRQAAQRAKWSYRRMLRFLLAKNTELEGQLLCDVGRGTIPRWTVTLGALRSVCSQWFLDPDGMQRQIEWLRGEVDDVRAEVRGKVVYLDKRLDMHQTKIVELAKKVG